MKLIPIPKDIIVQKNDEFFIGLGKQDLHTFVFLGVQPQGGEPTLLARIGKQKNSDSYCAMCWETLFSQSPSELRAESKYLSHHANYMAYSISYLHFRQFIYLMSLVNAKKKEIKDIANIKDDKEYIACCHPIMENEQGVQLQYGPIPSYELAASQREDSILKHANKLCTINTCRHTAVDLMEYTLGNNKTTNGISRSFLKNFPLHNPVKHLYIFPLPPTAYDAQGEKLFVLTKIYKRLEQLVKLHRFNDTTYDKFSAIKALYLEQAGIAPNNLQAALTSIKTWQQHNERIINTHRNSGVFEWFVSKTATAKMTDEIKQELLQHITPLSTA